MNKTYESTHLLACRKIQKAWRNYFVIKLEKRYIDLAGLSQWLNSSLEDTEFKQSTLKLLNIIQNETFLKGIATNLRNRK